jgi:hypothetical protein
MIHAGRMHSVPSVQCASPIVVLNERMSEVLPSPFDTDVTAEGSDNFVAYH